MSERTAATRRGRAFRLLFPISSVTAFVIAALLIAPRGAAGVERIAAPTGGTDLVVFGRDAAVSRPLSGSVQVYGGNALIESPVEGDAIVIGGDVTLRGEGRIAGNLIYAGGRVTGADGRIGGRAYPLTNVQGAAAAVAKPAVILSLLFAWLVGAVVLTLVAGRDIRYSSIEVRASAMHCFTLGLVAFTSFVITGIVFSYLVPFLVGIPLLAALAVFAIVTKVYGTIAVFHAVGSLVARPRTRDQLSGSWLRGDLAIVVVGMVLLGAIRLVPVVGPIVWSLASVFGIGCALATRFGRREPAFLAWRPVEA